MQQWILKSLSLRNGLQTSGTSTCHYYQKSQQVWGKGPCQTLLGGIVSPRQSLYLCIPLSLLFPCLESRSPDLSESSLGLAGRDHALRLCGAGFDVWAAEGKAVRVLFSLNPFFGDIHPEGTGCSTSALHWQWCGCWCSGLARAREAVDSGTLNVSCSLSRGSHLFADSAIICYLSA